MLFDDLKNMSIKNKIGSILLFIFVLSVANVIGVQLFVNNQNIVALKIFLATNLILSFLAVVVAWYILSKTIIDPISDIVKVANEIASGNLDHSLQGSELKGELGELINSFKVMTNNLEELINQVTDSSNTVASTAEEFAAATNEISTSTEELSSTIQQIAQGGQNQKTQIDGITSEIDNMTNMLRDTARSALAVAEKSTEATDAARKGSRSAMEAVERMETANQVVAESAGVVRELGTRSKEIGEIVNLITSIAEQTNLLALNAAIEAARAGEHGRGFAVVAEEVRKLAEGSGKAAEQIAVLIKEIQQETERAVDSMDHGAKEVSESTLVVNTALQALEEIAASVLDISAMIEQISSASENQTHAIEKIAKVAEEVSAVAEEAAASTEEASATTQEQTASMEEMNASARELAELSNNLLSVVGKFKVK